MSGCPWQLSSSCTSRDKIQFCTRLHWRPCTVVKAAPCTQNPTHPKPSLVTVTEPGPALTQWHLGSSPGRPESRLHMQGPCGLRVGLRPRCRADKPRCNRPSNPQGRTPAAPAGPHAPCRRLIVGRPESRLHWHMQGSCGLRIGLKPGCRGNKPRCNRPSNPQGRPPAAPAGRSTVTPTCAM